MKNLKLALIIGAVIALAAIVALVYSTTHKATPTTTSNLPTGNQGLLYTQYAFGFKLQMPETWKNYKAEEVGNTVTIYVPTSDQKYIQADGKAYAPIIGFEAASKKQSDVNNAMKPCLEGASNNGAQCTVNLGENNYFNISWFKPVGMPKTFPDNYSDKKLQSLVDSIRFFDLSGEPADLQYQNFKQGISFSYPNGIFNSTTNAKVYLPFSPNQQQNSLYEINHTTNTQHCALSGACTPTTTDLKIGLTYLPDQTIDKIRQTNIGSELTTETFRGRKFLKFSAGVEGEGINYFFVDAKNKGVAMFYQSYLDENIVASYKNAKDFMPLERQQTFTELVLNSVSLESDPQYIY